MSWQPLVSLEYALFVVPPSREEHGLADHAAAAPSLTGTLTTLIESCGGWQFGSTGLGP